ncbi:MAG: VWA domain-containing protein [Candidatus Solibacter sp.]
MRSIFSRFTRTSHASAPRVRSARAQGKRGSMMVLFTLMLPAMIIPIAGLAIDASIVRVVQLRLQGAVDGAVLGAGRLLGTPAVPETLAAQFLAANFRTDGSAGTWGAKNLTSSVVYTPGITKRIDVNASAQVPLLFMRVIGRSVATVSAAGSATRSDSRVVFVIDRSGSMKTDDGSGTLVITDAINYTTSLAKHFLPNADELGLVVFDGSAAVGYPANTWDPSISLASTGGPNKTFYDGANTDFMHQVANIKADSGTGMAEALSIAYIELQKAHMRDLQAEGSDTRLNSIVLLTDGVPSALSLYFNNPASSNANNIVKDSSSGSVCTNKTITAGTGETAAKMMKGWLALTGPAYSGTTPYGVFLMATQDANAAHTASWWMNWGGSSAALDYAAPNPTTPYAGCTGMYNNKPGNFNYVSKIPATDAWGNSLTTGGYTNSHVVGGSVSSIYTGTAFNASSYNSEYQWGLAIWNSVDNAAKRVRTDANRPNRTGDTSGPMNVQIYVIGYTGNGGCDDGLLKRVANDPTAAGYVSTEPRGQYYSAANGAELADAYNKLASDLLRLAR